MSNMPPIETMPVTEALRLIADGHAVKFCAFVALCEADCHALDITRDTARMLVERAASLGDTVTAFYNDSSGTLCIG